MTFEIFHAAVDARNYPFKNANYLFNVIENASTSCQLKTTRKLIEMLKPRNTILDSGGSTIFKAEKAGKKILSDPDLRACYKEGQLNLTPEHVIRAADALKPTAVVSLDWPLQEAHDDIDQEFEKKLAINLEWASKTVRLQKQYVPEINLLIPVQARNLNQFEQFMEGLSGLSFTGVSLPYRNLTPQLLVQYLVRLYQLRIPWVHILGTTSFANISIAAYFARQNYFKIISMDSSSWMINGKCSHFLSPHNLLAHQLNDKTVIPESLKNDCHCPFCQNVNFDDMTFNRYSSRAACLCSHNAFAIESVARELYRHSKTLDQLTNYVMKKTSQNDTKVKKAVDALFLAQKAYGI